MLRRLRHWYAVVRRSVWRFAIATPFALLSAFAFVRDEFLPREWQDDLKMLNWLPSWPWHWWAIIALAIVIVAILEGSYQEQDELSDRLLLGLSGSKGTVISSFVEVFGKRISAHWFGQKVLPDIPAQIAQFSTFSLTKPNTDRKVWNIVAGEANSLGHFSYEMSRGNGIVSLYNSSEHPVVINEAGRGVFDLIINDGRGITYEIQTHPMYHGVLKIFLLGWTIPGKQS